ncbi:MAG: MaoC/PaaZ C-terminal domain-containing protein [Desulfohalobiaceae bacterium]
MSTYMRRRSAQGLQEGDSFTISRTFTREDTRLMGDVTRDYNPVHYEPAWAKSKGFQEEICHGLLVGGMICEIGGQLAWLATGMSFSFLKPVYFGQTVTCRMTITSLDEQGRAEAKAEMFNEQGEKICLATLNGRLPKGEEKGVLQGIMDQGDVWNKLA